MPVRRPPTIDDVARRARVAKGTVSKALSPRQADGDVSAATRTRIEAVAAAMGYQPAWKRRAAAMRRARTIALAFGDVAPLANGVYADLAHALAREAVDAGYGLCFVPLLGDEAAWERRLRQQAVDALVLLEPIPAGIATLVQRLGRPAVVVNSLTAAPIGHLVQDEAAGARALVGHLRQLGHRRIGYVALPRQGRHYSEAERRAGVVAAAAAGAMPCVEAVDRPERLLAHLDAGHATAAVAYNPADALALLHQLHAVGRQVPRDLSLCCWDDDVPLQWSIPPITSLAPPVVELAQDAIATLIAVVEGRVEPASARQVRRFAGRLTVRASTAARR